jgi:hypothetical protein
MSAVILPFPDRTETPRCKLEKTATIHVLPAIVKTRMTARRARRSPGSTKLVSHRRTRATQASAIERWLAAMFEELKRETSSIATKPKRRKPKKVGDK